MKKQILSILTAAVLATGTFSSVFAISDGAYSTDTDELTEALSTMTDTEKEDYINENLDTKLRYLSNFAAVTANADYGSIADLAQEAYENGVTAVEMKEAVFQAAPYCGYTRAINALNAVDDALAILDIDIPTESRAGVTEDNRYDEGLAVQRQLFGSQIGTITDDMTAASKLQTLYLSGICFGDFYTRSGLDLNTREFLTFCTIMSNGGCLSQVNSHASANLGVGHNSAMLRAAVLANEEYNGEEKTFEALAIVNTLDDSAVGDSTAGETVPEAVSVDGYTTDAQELTDMMEHYKTDDADGYIGASLDADTQEILAEAAQAVVNTSAVPTSDDEQIQTLIDIAVLAADGTRADEFPAAVEAAMNAGNSADSMLAAVLLCVPYNGFPRTLNATSAINTAVSGLEDNSEESSEVTGAQTIILQIGNPSMTVDRTESSIDPDSAETVPVIVDDRTLLPVRAVVEAMGGTADWDDETRTVTLVCGENEITLTIDSTTAYLNGAAQTLDVAPTIINDRTMLPIRFIAESFGYSVDWNADTQEITIVLENTTPDAAAPTTEPTPAPTVESTAASTVGIDYSGDYDPDAEYGDFKAYDEDDDILEEEED